MISSPKSSKKPRRLSVKQRKFVALYAQFGNVEQAAIRAGYSKHTAGVQGRRQLHSVSVQNALELYVKKSLEKQGVTPERVHEELRVLLDGRVTDFFQLGQNGWEIKDLDLLTDAQKAAIQEIDLKNGKVKGYSRLQVIELYMKHLGRLERAQGPSTAIQININ